jgi:hypothetical protein
MYEVCTKYSQGSPPAPIPNKHPWMAFYLPFFTLHSNKKKMAAILAPQFGPFEPFVAQQALLEKNMYIAPVDPV